MSMQYLPELITGTGTAAAAAGAWRFLRSATGRALVEKVRGSIVKETVSLRAAIDNLSQVVAAQGESIEWLRGELENTRKELEEARSALNDKENRLEKENEKLRKRVAELEAQVKALEAALAKRTRAKKTTTGGTK